MDLPNRTEYESRLTTRIDRAFGVVRNAALQDRKPDSRALEESVQSAIEDQARAVYVVMFLLFLDDDRTVRIDPANYNRLESFAAVRGVEVGQARGAQIASGLSSDLDSLIRSGASKQDIVNAFDRQRAETIGVTETTALASRGYLESTDAVSEVLGVESEAWWITAKDDRVCPVCGPLHAKPRRYWSEFFEFGPPAHPNCRCTLDVEPSL